MGPHAVFRVRLNQLGRHGGSVQLNQQGATVRRSSEGVECAVIEDCYQIAGVHAHVMLPGET